MNKLFFGIALSLAIISCKQESKTETLPDQEVAQALDVSQYEPFGTEFTTENPLSTEDMLKKYDEMAVGDSMEVTFKGKVNSVCQSKGCWMKVDLGNPESESFVRFKDYKFFVPMDAAGSDAIVNGMAYKEETTVDELKHYAKDAKKSQEEIDAILEPKVEYTFIAKGVLLKKNS